MVKLLKYLQINYKLTLLVKCFSSNYVVAFCIINEYILFHASEFLIDKIRNKENTSSAFLSADINQLMNLLNLFNIELSGSRW